jgi:hypothetical protein
MNVSEYAQSVISVHVIYGMITKCGLPVVVINSLSGQVLILFVALIFVELSDARSLFQAMQAPGSWNTHTGCPR